MHYRPLKIPITVSIDCSIPRRGKISWNCCGTLLRREDFSWSRVNVGRIDACIWKSGTTWPVTATSSFQSTVNTTPVLFLLLSCMELLSDVLPVRWTRLGYFVLKCSNVLCLWFSQSAYCMSPTKNGCNDFSCWTELRKLESSCSKGGFVMLAWSLVITGGLVSNSVTLSKGEKNRYK